MNEQAVSTDVMDENPMLDQSAPVDRSLALEKLADAVGFSQGYINSTLPRGSLQVVQPARISEFFFRSYGRDFNLLDRASWQAILSGRAVRASDVLTGEPQDTMQRFLQSHGLQHVAAVPLAGPVLAGYPGVAYLCRGPDEADFSDEELARLNAAAAELDAQIDRERHARLDTREGGAWQHTAATRFYLIAQAGQVVYPQAGLPLEAALAERIQEHVRLALEQAAAGKTYPDRLLVPDAKGDMWVFHLVVHLQMPAVAAGPVAVVTLQPESHEWALVRPWEVAADIELTRMLPALRFMYEDFAGSPTLGQIAQKVSLSPFHFHRRFADLVGQTPKHFLLGCQIHQAKQLLASRGRELVQIASDCGFAHQSHFTSRFKQATGLTPTRWRRLVSKAQ